LVRPFVLMDTTRYRLIPALRMVTTGRSGSQAGYSSEQGHGITGLNISTGTSITISTIAGDIAVPSPPEANLLPNIVSRFVVERCMMLMAVKLPVVVDRFCENRAKRGRPNGPAANPSHESIDAKLPESRRVGSITGSEPA
jgi:hypothetical protein